MSGNVPQHIAIIMDGNGRWAQSRGLPRTAGHKQGAEAARQVAKDAASLGVKYLTLFGFSSENWNRPQDEIGELMRLLRYYLLSETAELHKNGARLRVIGSRAELESDIVELIDNAEALTKDNEKITVIIALNYGGRADIAHAVTRFIRQHSDNLDKIARQDIENLLPNYLMTAGIPDPDVLIRTSGEKRISNFLLWQCAYSEFVFTDTLWPDFSVRDLQAAIDEYGRRDRRYGGIRKAKG